MTDDLEDIAATLVADGKGILAADETVPTLTKRFDTSRHPVDRPKSRCTYREMLFTAGVAEFISGVIMQDETIRQKSSDGTPFTQTLSRQGILPGIKVDTGAKPLAGAPGETVTEGLDGLRDRLSDVPRPGRPFREVARGHPYQRRAAEPRLHQRQCARAGAVCGPLSGREPTSDRRAGSVDGRIAFDRTLRRDHRRSPSCRLFCAL